jgi:Uma2 family endonuclease
MAPEPVEVFAMDPALSETEFDSIDDLLVSLGRISAKRVRFKPAPGTATVDDVVRLWDRTRRIYELVDGTLVEKIMGAKESFIAMRVGKLIGVHSDAHGDVGMVLGPDGMVNLMKKLVRIPDVSFTNWARVPGRTVPDDPVPNLAPDLAVEVLSEGNTREEMERKLKEYFLSEVQLVWFIDPRARTVRVYTSPDKVRELGTTDVLDGGAVLPGFSVSVSSLFEQLAPARAAEHAKAVRPRTDKKPKKWK